MDSIDPRLDLERLDPQVRRIIACLQNTNRITDAVIQNLYYCNDSPKKEVQKEILFCLLMDELESIRSRTLSCATDSVQICGEGVDGVTRTMQQDTFGAVSTLPNSSAYCQSGQLFSVTRTISGRGRGFVNTAFQNPPGNTKTMHLESVLAGIGFQTPTIPRTYEEALSVSIAEANVTAEGTVIPENRNFGSTNASSLIVSLNPTINSTSSETLITWYPTGEVSLNLRGQVIVPPGHAVLVTIGTNLGDETDGFLYQTITWLEI